MDLSVASADVGNLAEWYRSLGFWGVLASIGLMISCALTVLPAEAGAIANGMVYGSFWGAALTWASALLGANIAFGIARSMGPRCVVKLAGSDPMTPSRP